MTRILIVFCAGGAGSAARYLVGVATGPRAFPYATLIVNLVGSCFIAFVFGVANARTDMSPNLKLALTTGFIGGFTTYSSFNYETTKLVLDGHSVRAGINVAVTLVGAFATGLLGWWLARRIAA